jgi:hypothetical protein
MFKYILDRIDVALLLIRCYAYFYWESVYYLNIANGINVCVRWVYIWCIRDPRGMDPKQRLLRRRKKAKLGICCTASGAVTLLVATAVLIGILGYAYSIYGPVKAHYDADKQRIERELFVTSHKWEVCQKEMTLSLANNKTYIDDCYAALDRFMHLNATGMANATTKAMEMFKYQFFPEWCNAECREHSHTIWHSISHNWVLFCILGVVALMCGTCTCCLCYCGLSHCKRNADSALSTFSIQDMMAKTMQTAMQSTGYLQSPTATTTTPGRIIYVDSKPPPSPPREGWSPSLAPAQSPSRLRTRFEVNTGGEGQEEYKHTKVD